MKNPNEDDSNFRFISASEISHYVFCSVSWYLGKAGAPRNKGSGTRMQKGVKAHSSLKRRYNAVRMGTYLVISVILVIVGYLFISLY